MGAVKCFDIAYLTLTSTPNEGSSLYAYIHTYIYLSVSEA